MKIAIFGTNITEEHRCQVEDVIKDCFSDNVSLAMYADFKKNLHSSSEQINDISEFTYLSPTDADVIISLGGDGTFLQCAHAFYQTNIPILGINLGKLGFLAQTNPNDTYSVIKQLQEQKFIVKKRQLLDFQPKGECISQGIGVNEITVQKSNAVKLIKINVYVSENFLCSFWADGVAVSTPTGSTGYSLSLGSPILTPENNSLIITPIAPHTLSVRPIVIPDNETIRIEAKGEFTDFLISNDYQSQTTTKEPIVEIKKSSYTLSVVELENTNFFETLREKLKLGFDIRK